MYITRRLSKYESNPSELTQPPPDGPNSGILVIHDLESRIFSQGCFGSYEVVDAFPNAFPFPQNLKLAVTFGAGGDDGTRDPILFIPVLDKPLSSNCYYAIHRCGKHSGEAYANAKEEDVVSSCFCFNLRQAKSKQLDPHDVYQQFKIHQKKSSSRQYHATSLAPDGVPPFFIQRKGWTVEYARSQGFKLRDDAKGLNTELRSKLPGLGMSVVVGKWYVPFIFLKDGEVKEQIKRSMYYSMTLEQRWKEVFSDENNDKGENRDVVVDVKVEDEVVKLGGQEITRGVDANGFFWFGDGDKKIGLGSVVVERMKREEERFGWTSKGDQTLSVKRTEKAEDGSSWKRYHCYVLIESFVLKRKDKSLVLTYDFTHVDKLKTQWLS